MFLCLVVLVFVFVVLVFIGCFCCFVLLSVDVVDAVVAVVVVFYFYGTVCFVRCAVCEGRVAFLSKQKKKARVRKRSSTAGSETAAAAP